MEEWNNQSLETWVDPHLTIVEEVLQDTSSLQPFKRSDSRDSSSSDSSPVGPS